MSYFRQTTKQSIFEKLDDSYFTKENFEVIFQDENSATLLEIKFIPNQNYYFKIRNSPAPKSYQFKIVEVPGDHFNSESSSQTDEFSSCISRISSWTNKIEADYREQTPVYKELDDLREAFERDFYEHLEDKDAHFSDAEKEDMYATIKEMNMKINELLEKDETDDNEFEDLKKIIDNIVKDLEVFPKGVWYRTAFNKLLNVYRNIVNTEDGKFLLKSIVKGFLPSSDDPS